MRKFSISTSALVIILGMSAVIIGLAFAILILTSIEGVDAILVLLLLIWLLFMIVWQYRMSTQPPSPSPIQPQMRYRPPRLFRYRQDRYGNRILFSTLNYPSWYILTPPNKAMRDWQQCLIEIWPNYVYIKQDKPLLPDEIFTFNMENIRWLSRVQPFSDTESEVWFDLEIDSLWHVLRVRMQKRLTKAMLDNLEPRLPKTLHMERHRHHPNTRHAPVTAYPAECTDDGNWSLMEPVELYLTPLYLVVLCNTFVERSMPLDEIRQFRLEQMDSQPDNYLIQFEWQTKTLAFATQDQGFAKMLQAAVN